MQADTSKRTHFVNSDDPTLILVKGSFHREAESEEEQRKLATEHVKRVASTITTVVAKHGVANVRCVGAASTNNGWKAITIAYDRFKERGVKLELEPSFQTVNFDGSGDKTAMAMKVTNPNGKMEPVAPASVEKK